jgi:hypothetical protein
MTSNNYALQSLRKLKTLVKVLIIDDRILEQALNSGFNDFEDAILYFTAVNHSMKIILSRNKTDHASSKITIATAEEFIKTWRMKSK